MPEMPEVETVVRGIREPLTGRKVEQVEVKEAMIIGYPDSIDEFKLELKGKTITGVSRRGKYIIIELSQGKRLITHLRMTGKLLLKPRTEPVHKHTRVIIHLDGGLDLRFNNMRKFGRMYLLDEDESEKAGGFATLGPEPLSPEFTVESLADIMAARTTTVKAILLNQQLIAGIGNIYCDEALFRAGIRPDRSGGSLDKEEIKALHQAINKVISAGIKFQGTSFSDYVNALGEKGSFQEMLKVYGRGGEPCIECGSIIAKVKIAGRSTHFCPKCQR
ncbi:MAG: DNA-formamidopyrimidine glycosylase [Bacillota bacterium]